MKNNHIHKGDWSGGGVCREESITYEEVIQAIKRQKNGKAAGIDGIAAEMLKCGGKK